jgi:hypothetical protein
MGNRSITYRRSSRSTDLPCGSVHKVRRGKWLSIIVAACSAPRPKRRKVHSSTLPFASGRAKAPWPENSGWKYALSLELADAGFHFTLLHDFRQRLLAHDGAQRLLDTFLAVCKARGWLKARGTQRTDSTHVLAAIRTLHRLERVLETLRAAMSLSRLWQQQARRTEARQLLADIYRWFTEGFDTADLQTAKMLLEGLA